MIVDSTTGAAVPLKSVSVSATVVDTFARVVVSQTFQNDDSSSPIEALYKFPLDEQAAVVAFEAEVGGRVVHGEIMDKRRAARTYVSAVSAGRSAFLAEEERADVFLIAVGNLAPNASATVRLTYVTTLAAEGSELRFTLPATIGARYTPPGHNEIGADSSNAAVIAPPASAHARFELEISIALEMTSAIQSFSSPTHPIRFKTGPSPRSGTVHLARTEYLDADFVLIVGSGGVVASNSSSSDSNNNSSISSNNIATPDHGNLAPTACVEPNGHNAVDGCTAMLSLVVPIATTENNAEPPGPIVFLIDRSGSMRGGKMAQCVDALQIFLRSLPVGTPFNIVSFGSEHSSLFAEGCLPLDDETLKRATDAVSSMKADMGGTELLTPLREIIRDAAHGSMSSHPRPPRTSPLTAPHRPSRFLGAVIAGFSRSRDLAIAAQSAVDSQEEEEEHGDEKDKEGGCGSGDHDQGDQAAGGGGQQVRQIRQTQVVILTDGQVSNTQAVLETVAAAARTPSAAAAAAGSSSASTAARCRFFSLGIGNGVSRELVAGIARCGRGVAEFAADGERIDAKVMRQLRRATRPALEATRLTWLRADGSVIAREPWHDGDNGDDEIDFDGDDGDGDGGDTGPGGAAGAKIGPIFAGERHTVLARLRGAFPARAVLTGRGHNGVAFETHVMIPPPQRLGAPHNDPNDDDKDNNNNNNNNNNDDDDAGLYGGPALLATFAARERIRVLQDTRGDAAAAQITAIALRFGIASRHTAFVAVGPEQHAVGSAATAIKTVVVPQMTAARSGSFVKSTISSSSERFRSCSRFSGRDDQDAAIDDLTRQIAILRELQNECLDTVLDRSECLAELEVQSASLELSSAHFYKKSSSLSVGTITRSILRPFAGGGGGGATVASSADDPLTPSSSSSPTSSSSSRSTSTPTSSTSTSTSTPTPTSTATTATLSSTTLAKSPPARAIRLQEVLNLQLADGHWAWTAEIDAWFADALDALGVPNRDAAVATCLVLALLRARFSRRREVWSMMEAKAQGWLAQTGTDCTLASTWSAWVDTAQPAVSASIAAEQCVMG
jgi:hypothetical protein